jgi:hypothetical protein
MPYVSRSRFYFIIDKTIRKLKIKIVIKPTKYICLNGCGSFNKINCIKKFIPNEIIFGFNFKLESNQF